MKKRLTRSSDDRILAGVCGGIAEYFSIDSTWVRLGLILITPFSYFLSILVYIICVFLIPEKRNIQETNYRLPIRRRIRRTRDITDTTKEFNDNKK